MLLTRLV
jgi:hypothetical protein